MTLEPESLQPSQPLIPPSSDLDEVEEALHLLELDPATTNPFPSPEETAAALDWELEAAVQSATPNPQMLPTDSPLEALYAKLLEEERSSPAAQQQAEESFNQANGWEQDEFIPTVPTRSSIAPTPSRPVAARPEFPRQTLPLQPGLHPDVDSVEAPTPADTIAALTDLLPETELDAPVSSEEIALQTWESLQVNPDAPTTEEGFLQASPDEDLLPTEEAQVESEEGLQLDPSTLHQLESDLHRLEGIEADSTEPTENLAPGSQPTEAELDAIFPAFVLSQTAQSDDKTTAVEDPLHTDSPAADPPDSYSSDPREEWYLGLDFGTTGISAVLLHRPTAALYPIYWWKSEPPNPPERLFRLPSTAYLSLDDETPALVAIGWEALDLQIADAALGEQGSAGILLQGFKSCLNAGLPWTDDRGQPQPVLQWSQGQSLPLEEIQTAVQKLLATIAERAAVYDPASEDPAFPERATHSSESAIPRLAGIVLGISDTYSDAYRFNLREAILKVGLVPRPEQVAFLKESMAAVLSALPRNEFTPVVEGNWLFSPEWGGMALTIEAGATATELMLVDLPPDLDELTEDRFHRHSFAYGGHAIDQDIISQLLWHDDWLHGEFSSLPAPVFPQPGEPDVAARIAFDRWLQSSALGQFLLGAATQIKVKLQEQERLTIEWGDLSIGVQRRDLESRVLVAYVQRLNRELNGLLSRTGISVEGINQALCTGGNASWAALARWLRQKLPNATIAQDVYPKGESTSCSRVAYGLAALPLYPNLLGTLSPQYSDYFLLRELLEAFPHCTLSLQELLPLLERRGINVRVCQPRILEFLEGGLPLGLHPTEPDAEWLTQQSRQHPLYEQLKAMPLFECVGDRAGSLRDRAYRPHPEQVDRLQQYLRCLTLNTIQRLEEPEIVSLGISHP